MTIARELVTLLRYEIDDSNLRAFEKRRPGGGRPDNVPGLPPPGVIDRTATGLGRIGTMLRGLIAGFSILSAARIADEWAGVQGRVSLVTEGIEEQTKALDGLYALSQRSRQSYTATAQVFQGIQRNGKELGITLDDALKLTETIGTAMTIGGGSAASQEAALVQLSQALGTGTLRGEELNSIMEQAPRLAQAIAKAFDVPVGKLKDLGKEGKLATKQLAKGLLKQSELLREEFERMPMTFSGAWVTLSNAFGRQIDKLNRSSGAARIFYKITSAVVDNLETIIKYIAWIGAAAGLTKLAYAAKALAASGGLFARILARFGGAQAFGVLIGTFARMLAVATAIYYVFDDISGWFNGADSLLGRVIGPTSDWLWLLEAIKTALTFIKNLFGDTSTLEAWLSKWGLIGVIIFGVVAAIGLVPAAITAGIIAAAALFNYLRNNWTAIGDYVLNLWARIKDSISNAVPDWMKRGYAAVTSFASGADSAMKGWATPGTMPGSSTVAGGVTTVTNAPQITINAPNSQPAAVADAAQRGVQRGMGSALVPQVEASR